MMTFAPSSLVPGQEIPVIETEDLVLRGPRESDFNALADFYASDRAKFVGGPRNRFESWKAFLADLGHWVLRGYGKWTIEHRTSGETVGRTGIIYHDGWQEPELGWVLYEGFEGQGLALQASRAARSHAARHWALDGLISYIDPRNERSIALAKRLGARFECEGNVVGESCHIWRHPSMEESQG
ncbi:MAG: GNAT family N-acetyltransferase [Pseudomonadota bacterium]